VSDLINKYVIARKTASELRTMAHELESRAEEEALAAALPDRLRPAEPKDIIIGAVIWYPEWAKWDGGRGWNVVDEVYRPDDQWKAYCAHDGCRYGLDGAFVECTTEALMREGE